MPNLTSFFGESMPKGESHYRSRRPRGLYSGRLVKMVSPSGYTFEVEAEVMLSLLNLGWKEVDNAGNTLARSIVESNIH